MDDKPQMNQLLKLNSDSKLDNLNSPKEEHKDISDTKETSDRKYGCLFYLKSLNF